MKERIYAVVGNKAKFVWAGTYHSIFAKILRIEAAKIGFTPNFTIYDSDDTKSLIGDIISEMQLDKQVYIPGQIRSRISSAKSNLISPKAYTQHDELVQQDKMNKIPLFPVLYERRCV